MNSRKTQLEEMLREDPKDPFLIYALALEVAKEGDVKNAVERVEELLKNDPEYLGAYYQLGQWLEKLSQNEKAIAVYKAGMELARRKNNPKAEGELRSAMELLE